MIISCFVGGKRFISRLALVAAVVGLAACGGGGGGGSKSSSSVSVSSASSASSSAVSTSSSVSSSSSSVAPDVKPKEFTLSVPKATYAPNELATTNTVTITEIDALADISVSAGASYSVDGGAYTSVDGKIANDQTLTVRINASATFGETLTVSVTVGTLTTTFDVVTEDKDTAPNAFGFDATPDADLDSVYTSAAAPITGINSPATVTVSDGGSFCIGNDDYCGEDTHFTTAGAIENGQLIRVRGRSSDTNSDTVSYTLTIGGEVGTWSVETLADTTPPTAEIVFPTKVSLTDGTTLIVRGTAADASGIESVTVSVLNDGAVAFDPVIAVALEEGDLTSWKATVTLTPETVNTVRVSVTDGAGNTDAAAAEVAVTQMAAYGGKTFPEDGSTIDLTSIYADVELDIERGRLLLSQKEQILSISLDSSWRSVLIDKSLIPDLGYIQDMAVFGGNLYYQLNLDVVVLSADLTQPEVASVSELMDTSAGSNIDMVDPFGVSVNSQGLLYVVDRRLPGIYSVDPATGIRTLVSGAGLPEAGDNLFEDPQFIALDEAASLAYVADYANKNLYSVDLNSGVREVLTTLAEVPRGLEFDPEEQLLYVSEKWGTRIVIYDLKAGSITDNPIDAAVGANAFTYPKGMALTPDKVLYFVAGDSMETCGSLMAVDLMTRERVVITKDACGVWGG